MRTLFLVAWCWLLTVGIAGGGVPDNGEKRLRPAAVAGSWYPGNPEDLRAYLEGQLVQAEPPPVAGLGEVRAVLAPHAGYRFSGPTAALAFKPLVGKQFKRVVAMGPSHHGDFGGLVVSDATHFATPLGEIPLDREAIRQLRRAEGVRVIPGVDRNEHSLEMQLPWLQVALESGWQLVPVLVGQADAAGYARAAAALRPLLDGETLLVLSGDWTHYGPNYGYLPFPPDEKAGERLKQLDLGAWERIAHGDAKGLLAYRERTGITACAFGPMMVFLHLSGRELTATLAGMATSGPVTRDNPNSVGYLAAWFVSGHPLSGATTGELTQEEMTQLHELARKALRLAVSGGPEAANAQAVATGMTLPETLKQPRGAFVTLKRGEDLRGCIGYIAPIKPLYEAVVENAVNAALRDHRFRPVRSEELPGLNLEVSVLSPLTPVDSYREIEVGRHGMTLSKMGRNAVFLPEVAPEQGWNLEQTLTELALKAGLPGDAWKENARFEVFTAQKWTAPFTH
ncbi:MAG: AmmeMemoRadiSam system protein B [Magnetococcales bacterium]|nr:AmmeMemoRadiSam system protein B [Magnetococcales bacterium]